MTTKKEQNTILQSIEDEFRHDLALHLFSTHILHQHNDRFPRKKWAAWPLSLQQVPDPKNCIRYMDEVDYLDFDNSRAVAAELETDRYDEAVDEELYMIDDIFQDAQEDINNEYPRHLNVSLEEKLSDPTKDLRMELNSCFQRKVYNKIEDYSHIPSDFEPIEEITDKSSAIRQEIAKTLHYHHQERKPIQPKVDPPVQLSEDSMSRLIGKLDGLFEDLVQLRTLSREYGRASQKDIYQTNLLNWKDVVGCCDKLNDNITNKRLKRKFELMFDTKNVVEYESEEEEDDTQRESSDEEVFHSANETTDEIKRPARLEHRRTQYHCQIDSLRSLILAKQMQHETTRKKPRVGEEMFLFKMDGGLKKRKINEQSESSDDDV